MPPFVELYFRYRIYGFYILPVILIVLFGIWLFQRVSEKASGIIAIGPKEGPFLYVNVKKVYIINIQKALNHASPLGQATITRLFGADATAYLCGSSRKELKIIGVVDGNGIMRVISQEGLERGQKGLSLEEIRYDMHIHASALSPKN